LCEIVKYLKSRVVPRNDVAAKKLVTQESMFSLVDNVLYYITASVIPECIADIFLVQWLG